MPVIQSSKRSSTVNASRHLETNTVGSLVTAASVTVTKCFPASVALAKGNAMKKGLVHLIHGIEYQCSLQVDVFGTGGVFAMQFCRRDYDPFVDTLVEDRVSGDAVIHQCRMAIFSRGAASDPAIQREGGAKDGMYWFPVPILMVRPYFLKARYTDATSGGGGLTMTSFYERLELPMDKYESLMLAYTKDSGGNIVGARQ